MTAARPGLTYWRCPECEVRLEAEFTGGPPGQPWRWDQVDDEAALHTLESMVEAHEARHGIGAA